MRWTVTADDRDEHGRIWVTPPGRTLADLLPKPEGEEHPPRKPWRPSKMELAGLVSGGVLIVAVIAFLNSFAPAPAPRLTSPTAVVAATRTPTVVPTPTRAPTATATPEPTEVPPTPTPEVVYIEVPPACDPATNPRFAVEIDLSPIGRVRGVSCTSQEEAQQNADRLAAAMRATAEASRR